MGVHSCRVHKLWLQVKGFEIPIGGIFRAFVTRCRSSFRPKPSHSANTHNLTDADLLQHPAVTWLSAITGFKGVLVAPWPADFEADRHAVAAQREQR